MYSDTDSFHPSMWEEERQQRRQIKFDLGELDEAALGRLTRTPTPYPKEMKQRIQHVRNMAQLKQTHLQQRNGDVIGATGATVAATGDGGVTQDQYERVGLLETKLRFNTVY